MSILVAITPTPPATTNDFAWDEDPPEEVPSEYLFDGSDDFVLPLFSQPVFDDGETEVAVEGDPLPDEPFASPVFSDIVFDENVYDEIQDDLEAAEDSPISVALSAPIPDDDEHVEPVAEYSSEDDLTPPSIFIPVLDEDEPIEFLAFDLILDDEIITADPLPPVIIFDWLGEDDAPPEEEVEALDPSPDEPHPATTEPPEDEAALFDIEEEPVPEDEFPYEAVTGWIDLEHEVESIEVEIQREDDFPIDDPLYPVIPFEWAPDTDPDEELIFVEPEETETVPNPFVNDLVSEDTADREDELVFDSLEEPFTPLPPPIPVPPAPAPEPRIQAGINPSTGGQTGPIVSSSRRFCNPYQGRKAERDYSFERKNHEPIRRSEICLPPQKKQKEVRKTATYKTPDFMKPITDLVSGSKPWYESARNIFGGKKPKRRK